MDVSSAALSFSEYWEPARVRLEAGFARELPRFFHNQPAPLIRAVDDVLAGGKRLRGGLVVLLNDALGGAPAAAILRAIAVECVQAASLIHDDLVDGDFTRRNRPATWTTHGPRRAVLLGDLIFATALHRMAELGSDDVRALAEAIGTMASGAYHEPMVPLVQDAAPASDPVPAYAQLIHLKTGVLFGTAARLGALAARASPARAALAFDYGARIGEAYQIADDVQDLVGLEAGPAPGAAQLPLLLPALRQFCPQSEEAAPDLEEVLRLLPRLREGMLRAIEARLQQAEAVADRLTDGACQALLRTAPRDIVRTMLADAR